MLRRLLLAIVLTFPALVAGAAEIVVPATDGALVRAIESARAGDILRLGAGTHSGPVVIGKPAF